MSVRDCFEPQWFTAYRNGILREMVGYYQAAILAAIEDVKAVQNGADLSTLPMLESCYGVCSLVYNHLGRLIRSEVPYEIWHHTNELFNPGTQRSVNMVWMTEHPYEGTWAHEKWSSLYPIAGETEFNLNNLWLDPVTTQRRLSLLQFKLNLVNELYNSF